MSLEPRRPAIELYQAEWCPHSHRVRQRLTELGLDFVARQVPVDPAERAELEGATGRRSIPTLVLVKSKRAVARLDGRVSAPRIEAMLEPHLAPETAALVRPATATA